MCVYQLCYNAIIKNYLYRQKERRPSWQAGETAAVAEREESRKGGGQKTKRKEDNLMSSPRYGIHCGYGWWWHKLDSLWSEFVCVIYNKSDVRIRANAWWLNTSPPHVAAVLVASYYLFQRNETRWVCWANAGTTVTNGSVWDGKLA